MAASVHSRYSLCLTTCHPPVVHNQMDDKLPRTGVCFTFYVVNMHDQYTVYTWSTGQCRSQKVVQSPSVALY